MDYSQEDIAPADPRTAFTSIQSTTEAFITILTRQLQHKWVSKRAPKGLQKQLAETRACEATATERIFLDNGGMAAWVAYFRATYGNHIAGQRFPDRCLAAFHHLSDQDRINAARRVADVQQDSDVAKIISNASQKRRHRRKVLLNVEASSRSVPPPNETQNGPGASANLRPNETQSSPTAIPSLPPSNTAQLYRVHEHASPEGILDVFNNQAGRAIKGDPIQHNGKTYLKAAITMSFSEWIMDDCIMTLSIDESMVGDIAKALFNVQIVKSRQHIRSLVFPGGVEATPSPELSLKGVSDHAFLDIFGPNIYSAVVASNIGVAHGVSMIVSANASDTIVINLTLETIRASQIREKILPKI